MSAGSDKNPRIRSDGVPGSQQRVGSGDASRSCSDGAPHGHPDEVPSSVPYSSEPAGGGFQSESAPAPAGSAASDDGSRSVPDEDPSAVPQLAIASIFEHNLVPQEAPANSPIVLMVSGGSDSTAMCLLAHELVQEGFIEPGRITVLHVNHGLRGDDSFNDAVFVERLAGLAGFPFELRYIDIYSQLEELGGNVESAGRYLRYEVANQLADELCDKAGVDHADGRIWVAHTQDDRVETFFMRAIVGTGPGGFASIRYSNGRVVRPLLDTTREQLREYIAQRIDVLGWQLDPEDVAQVPGGLWREDATNYDTKGFRSFVRHELVPLAKQRNPNLGGTLSRTIDLITEENDAIEVYVGEARARSVSTDGNRTTIDLDEARTLEKPFLRRLVYSVCKDVLPVGERIEQKHIDIIMSSMDRPGFSMDLPGDVRVFHEYGNLVFETRCASGPAWASLEDEVELPVPGHVFIGMHIRVSVSRVDPGDVAEFAADAVVDGIGAASSDAAAAVGGSDVSGLDTAETAATCPDAAAADVAGADAPVPAPSAHLPVGNVEYAKAHSGSGTVFVDEGRLLAACHEVYPEPEGTDAGAAPHLVISHREPGDFVCPLGMGGAHKKLSDVFVDKKIRRSARDEALVIRAGSSIVWVVGVVQDERFRVSDGRSMLRIDVENV